jgi:polyhydroxybutyrate depolymerase
VGGGLVLAASTPAAAAPRVAPCATSVVAGESSQVLTVDGTLRTYRLAVPPDPARRRLPLVLNFHGYNSDAVQQAAYSQLEQVGPARGFVVATPQGTGTPAFWNIFPKLAQPNDVGLTRAIIGQLEATACVDPHRVYATGISNGAGLSAYLGCALTKQLAAIAPVAGVNLFAGCPQPGTPLSVVAFHGTDDPTVAYGGGRPTGILSGEVLDPVTTSVAKWARHDRCGPRPTTRQIRPHVIRTDYPRCAAGTAVTLYTIVGGGHTWPGALSIPSLGPVTHEISATDLLLSFFAQHDR